ncbi:hypothetical protein BDN72DRAFT_391861 [Pluteus cervinus]|uniref:Uncharacterized protein n=1 Tax=Pluteus cervinus TaxID=181527 RepID=A0ACD3A9U8_9AGAR|nr:hypothetical protein BDN72DRAFT_391861 [Pluteus cervinus]
MTNAPPAIVFNIQYNPMPVPISPEAPKFKGKFISRFLETLEILGENAGKPLTDLPRYVLRYCAQRVRDVIGYDAVFRGCDWGATKAHMINLYGASEKKKIVNSERFRQWVDEARRISSLKHVEKYYRTFRSYSVPLKNANRILEHDVNFLFYKGIPEKLRRRVRKRLPPNKTTLRNLPTVEETLTILRDLFDPDDIETIVRQSRARFNNSTSSASDSDSESSTSSDSEDDDCSLGEKNLKRTHSSTSSSTASEAANAKIEILTRRVEELTEKLANYVALANVPKSVGSRLSTQTNIGLASHSKDKEVCSMCKFENGSHRLGDRYCSEVKKLLEDKIVHWKGGRLVTWKNTDIPLSQLNVENQLRNEWRASRASSFSKGRVQEAGL